VAELETARHLSRTDEITGDHLVERIERGRLVEAPRLYRQVELERVTDDGGGLGEVAARLGKPAELAGDRGRDGRRNPLPAVAGGGERALTAAGELQQVEGIAAAALIQPVGCGGRPHQLGGVLRIQRPQLEDLDFALPHRALDGGRQGGISLAGAEAADDHHRGLRRPAENVTGLLDRRRIGPMQVVEEQQHRLARRQALDHLDHGLVGAESLDRLARLLGSVGERPQRGKQPRQLGHLVGGDPLEGLRVQ
jgi:hypothetical protein